jgi:hypothetical protein
MTHSLADLRFMAARVIAYVKAHPPTEPLLGDEPAPRVEVCQRGHTEMSIRADGKRYCARCSRERQRAKRAMRRPA